MDQVGGDIAMPRHDTLVRQKGVSLFAF